MNINLGSMTAEELATLQRQILDEKTRRKKDAKVKADVVSYNSITKKIGQYLIAEDINASDVCIECWHLQRNLTHICDIAMQNYTVMKEKKKATTIRINPRYVRNELLYKELAEKMISLISEYAEKARTTQEEKPR